MAAPASLRLYSNKICPFAHRALIAAAEKGAEYEYVHIELGAAKPAWYLDVNPRGTVPALGLADGRVLLESMFVATYLDEAAPAAGTLLWPADPLQRYEIRLVIDEFGNAAMGPLYQLLKNAEASADKEIVAKVEAGVAKVVALFERQSGAGPFFLGEAFSMADVALAPFFHRFKHTLKHYRGYDLLGDDASRPQLARLRRWLEACEARPSFEATKLTPEQYIAGYESYGGKPRELEL